MKRWTTGVLAAALMVPTLSACGGGDSDFCDAAPADIDTNDPAAMRDAIEDVKDDAPDELQDDLDVIVTELDKFEEDPASVDATALTDAADALIAWEEENC